MAAERKPTISLTTICLLGAALGVSPVGADEAPTDVPIKLEPVAGYPDSAWNPEYKSYLLETPNWLPEDWKSRIQIDAFPDLATTRGEIAALIALVPAREAAQPGIDAELDPPGIFAEFLEVLADTPYDAWALKQFTRKAFEDATRAAFFFKDKNNRARPYHYYPALKPSIAPPGHPSYPSGHATQGYTLAFALADAFPEQRIALEKVAYQLARHREIGGVHYRSDSLAGEQLARQLVREFRQNADYRKLIVRIHQH